MKASLGLGSILALSASLLVAPAAFAQDDMLAVSHPAHIHAGSCPAPGDVVAPLGDVSISFLVDGTASASETPIGQATALPVKASITKVALPLADIAAGTHAIVVHASKDDMGTYVLCGDIGGLTIGTADLPVALGGLNDSGIAGLAWLHDNGDGSTTVNLFAVPAVAPAAAG